MSFAEKAEHDLVRLMLEHRDGAFKTLEKSSRGEKAVVKYLIWREKPVNPKKIAEDLNLSSARVAAILGNLEKKEIILRTMEEDDRRRINVSLTALGFSEAKKDKKEIENRIIEVFNQMGEKDTKKFIALTSQFLAISHKINQEEGEQ